MFSSVFKSVSCNYITFLKNQYSHSIILNTVSSSIKRRYRLWVDIVIARSGSWALHAYLISLHVTDHHDLRLGAEVQGQFRCRICTDQLVIAALGSSAVSKSIAKS